MSRSPQKNHEKGKYVVMKESVGGEGREEEGGRECGADVSGIRVHSRWVIGSLSCYYSPPLPLFFFFTISSSLSSSFLPPYVDNGDSSSDYSNIK